MRAYEALFLMKPDLEKEEIENFMESLKGLIKDYNAELIEVDDWGKRKLAYTIQGYDDGFYILLRFRGAPEICERMERLFRISEMVMKYLITRAEEKEQQGKKAEEEDQERAEEEQGEEAQETPEQPEEEQPEEETTTTI